MIENRFYQSGAFLTINKVDKDDWSHEATTYSYNSNAVYLFLPAVQVRLNRLIRNVFNKE